MSSRFFIGTSLLTLAMLFSSIPGIAHAETLDRQLQFGMSGSDVSALQTFLARDTTIYPQGLVTGYFGSLTKSAVSNFQARNGIATVGRVGPITLAAINAQMNNGNVTGSNRTSPMIGPITVGTTNSGATMSWNTNENASAIIYYNTSPLILTEASVNTGVTISGSTLLTHTDLRSSHQGTLTGLQPNTNYYYSVYTRDGSGNESITLPSTFQTKN